MSMKGIFQKKGHEMPIKQTKDRPEIAKVIQIQPYRDEKELMELGRKAMQILFEK